MFVLLVTLVLIFLSAVTAHDSQYKALRFGYSSSDYVSFQHDMSPFRESLTLCTWIKRVSTSASHPYPIVFEYRTSTHEILIGAAGHYNGVVDDSGLGDLQSKFTHPVGSWFSYCLSWSLESRTMRLYLDGTLIGTHQTSSGRTLVMGGTLWFNSVSGGSSSHMFGGELFQFNMYSAVLSDNTIQRIADGGLCYDLSEFDGIRALSWDRIFTKSRSGNVREVTLTVCENLFVAADRLNKSEARLARAEERLQVVSVELNETKTELVEMQADLNETESELQEVKEELNTTETELATVKSGQERMKERLESERAQHNRTKERLESERAQHNKTEERLETCSTSLTELEKRAEETRTLQNITRWDVLYTQPYFNQVFTEDLLEKLSSSWDMLSKFVGVNMTEGIVEHLRKHHKEPVCDKFEQFSPYMLIDFLGVEWTMGLIEHFQETHVESPCNNDIES